MRAVFPGSFDPATRGHLDVVRRAAGMFDEVVMCVLTNPRKTGRLPLAERLALLAGMTSDLANVTVDSSAGRLLADYCRGAGIGVIVRGVRTQADLEHELPMAQMNRHLSGIETLFVPADPAQAYISSTVIAAVSNSEAAPRRIQSNGTGANRPSAGPPRPPLGLVTNHGPDQHSRRGNVL